MATDLHDDVLLEGTGAVGPVEVKFVGKWPRVEEALKGLRHGPVRYRWSTDSTDALALFIEVPLDGNPPPDTVLQYRDRLRGSLNQVEGSRPVYIHFIDSATLAQADA